MLSETKKQKKNDDSSSSSSNKDKDYRNIFSDFFELGCTSMNSTYFENTDEFLAELIGQSMASPKDIENYVAIIKKSHKATSTICERGKRKVKNELGIYNGGGTKNEKVNYFFYIKQYFSRQPVLGRSHIFEIF